MSARLVRLRSSPLFSFFDPQEAHLGAEVESVSDVGEEMFRETRGAGCHAGPIGHCVVMDVLRQDASSLEKNSEIIH